MSAGEAAYHVGLKGQDLDAGISYHSAYNKDSLLKVVSTNAATWLEKLRHQPIAGLQLDPAGRVSVVAGNEAVARQQIADRLATPGLSVADRAYTYRMAVMAFTSWHYPDRLPIAEEYLTALAKMGLPAAAWQIEARGALVFAYYMLGRSPDIVRHGVPAVKLLPSMPYIDQGGAFGIATMTAEALTGVPGGLAMIDTLDTILSAAVHPPAELLAKDTVWVPVEEWARKWAYERWIKQRELLGRIGAPLVAQYWINRPTHDSTSIAINDGKIRIVEFFQYQCSGCVGALSVLDRIKKKNPFVEVLGVTATRGFWGNRLVEPLEEAKLVGEKFVSVNKLILPIGIVTLPKQENEFGGMSSDKMRDDPNYACYPQPILGKAVFFLLDGKGVIRRIVIHNGEDGVEFELQIERTIQFLAKEAEAAKGVRMSLSTATEASQVSSLDARTTTPRSSQPILP